MKDKKKSLSHIELHEKIQPTFVLEIKIFKIEYARFHFGKLILENTHQFGSEISISFFYVRGNYKPIEATFE